MDERRWSSIPQEPLFVKHEVYYYQYPNDGGPVPPGVPMPYRAPFSYPYPTVISGLVSPNGSAGHPGSTGIVSCWSQPSRFQQLFASEWSTNGPTLSSETQADQKTGNETLTKWKDDPREVQIRRLLQETPSTDSLLDTQNAPSEKKETPSTKRVQTWVDTVSASSIPPLPLDATPVVPVSSSVTKSSTSLIEPEPPLSWASEADKTVPMVSKAWGHASEPLRIAQRPKHVVADKGETSVFKVQTSPKPYTPVREKHTGRSRDSRKGSTRPSRVSAPEASLLCRAGAYGTLSPKTPVTRTDVFEILHRCCREGRELSFSYGKSWYENYGVYVDRVSQRNTLFVFMDVKVMSFKSLAETFLNAAFSRFHINQMVILQNAPRRVVAIENGIRDAWAQIDEEVEQVLGETLGPFPIMFVGYEPTVAGALLLVNILRGSYGFRFLYDENTDHINFATNVPFLRDKETYNDVMREIKQNSDANALLYTHEIQDVEDIKTRVTDGVTDLILPYAEDLSRNMRHTIRAHDKHRFFCTLIHARDAIEFYDTLQTETGPTLAPWYHITDARLVCSLVADPEPLLVRMVARTEQHEGVSFQQRTLVITTPRISEAYLLQIDRPGDDSSRVGNHVGIFLSMFERVRRGDTIQLLPLGEETRVFITLATSAFDTLGVPSLSSMFSTFPDTSNLALEKRAARLLASSRIKNRTPTVFSDALALRFPCDPRLGEPEDSVSQLWNTSQQDHLYDISWSEFGNIFEEFVQP